MIYLGGVVNSHLDFDYLIKENLLANTATTSFLGDYQHFMILSLLSLSTLTARIIPNSEQQTILLAPKKR